MNRVFLSIVLAALLTVGCVGPSSTLEKNWQRTELGFGFGLKNGAELSEDQWRQFLTDEVTPRFPAGLSVMEMHGQWRDPAGKVVRENSRMVVILHPVNKEDDRRIEEIRSAYVKKFEQDAVMRIDSPVNVRF